MYKVKDLSNKYGLSLRQVRYRLTQLDSLLNGHLSTGKKQATLIDDYALNLFDRLMELEGDSRTTKDAVNQIEQELSNTDSKGNGSNVKQRSTVIEQLEKRINELESDKAYLKQQLEVKDQQIQQLLPGSTNGKGILRRIWERIW